MGSTNGNRPAPAIPTIDISSYLAPNASSEIRQVVIDAVGQACHNYGFFNLVGHGIPDYELNRALDAAKAFHALPKEEKMEVWIEKSGMAFKGYVPPKVQIQQEGLLPDTKEMFMFGKEVSQTDTQSQDFQTGPNQWPSSLPKSEFHDVVMRHQARMFELVKTISNILAQKLSEELGKNIVKSLHENATIPTHLIHYGPVAVKDERQFGVAEHTDFGWITILLQEEGTTGLEVFHPPTETWIPVPVLANGFVVNMGDMMHRYTGGHFRSARHRVQTSKDQHRHSIAFFLNGDPKLKVTPLDGSGEEFVVGECIRQRVRETLGKAGD